LPEGQNDRNQSGFQYILSIVDFATCYLQLLHLCHKTAKTLATALFDEVMSRVSVPSAILMDQGGKFIGEVVCIYNRLGITHLWTSAYHPKTDAKCERVHFSVHNMVTKLVGDKHFHVPDLLSTVTLAYDATVHSTMGYSPHEFLYSFSPACQLDACDGDSTSARTSRQRRQICLASLREVAKSGHIRPHNYRQRNAAHEKVLQHFCQATVV